MEVVEGTSPMVDKGPENAQFSFPHLLMRELLCFLVLFVFLSVISLLFDAPLEELANPAKTPNPAKAPWYFLGLQELVSHSAFVGGVLVPGLMVLGLMALPYLDKNPSRKYGDRKLALFLFTLFVFANLVFIVIGTYFRGPNWGFYMPWAMPKGH